jgi:hypothetical protein
MTSGTFSFSATDPNHPKGHMGVDMGCSAGTPCYAFGPGVVNLVGTDPSGGNVVGVQHANGVWSYYAHMSTVKAQKGDKVDTNTIVGSVGNTGNASRGWPHLHFGVKEHGQWVNPAKYISVPPYNPDYGRNPQKYQKMWASEQAKQEASAFNMKSHLADRRVAFSKDIDTICKLSQTYYQLAKSR